MMKKKRRGRAAAERRRVLIQVIFFFLVIMLLVSIVVMIRKWNKGQASDYDPDEVTTEFDTEPNDYILPLSSAQVEGKTDDGVLTILTLGNSPFADGYPDNNLAKALADKYGATVINGGIEGSYITCRNAEYSDDDEEDGVSLPAIADALCTGDFSVADRAASQMSDQAVSAVNALKNTELSSVDCIMIMYDLEDYRDHRPLGSEGISDVTAIYGAIHGSIEKIRTAYPYIRVVYLSQPAGGVTIDGFFVDGDIHDIGCGLLSDYVTFELEAAASASASFVDVYYGAINVDQRDDYLINDYHINDAGASAVASRVYSLIQLQP